jgi:hypothetical protein
MLDNPAQRAPDGAPALDYVKALRSDLSGEST